VNDYDVGDVATFTLTVAPSDVDTSAVPTVTDPAGAESTPGASANADRSQWTTNVPLDQAGLWTVEWTVTGTGAGAETQQVYVSGELPFAHASAAELASWLGDVPVAGASRILARASELVDDKVMAAYETDVDGHAVDATVAAALSAATCAQVEQWIEVGEELDISGFPSSGGFMLGRLQITDLPATLAPRAARALRAEGLLTASVA
jgi:hypothetical protein